MSHLALADVTRPLDPEDVVDAVLGHALGDGEDHGPDLGVGVDGLLGEQRYTYVAITPSGYTEAS